MRRNGYTLIQLLAALFGAAVSAVIFYPVVGRAPTNTRVSNCRSNLKQIYLAMIQYAQDHDERLPPIALNATASETQFYGWADAIQPYAKTLQFCSVRLSKVLTAQTRCSAATLITGSTLI